MHQMVVIRQLFNDHLGIFRIGKNRMFFLTNELKYFFSGEKGEMDSNFGRAGISVQPLGLDNPGGGLAKSDPVGAARQAW